MFMCNIFLYLNLCGKNCFLKKLVGQNVRQTFVFVGQFLCWVGQCPMSDCYFKHWCFWCTRTLCNIFLQHLTPHGINNTLDYNDFYDEIKESFICSSIHVFQQDHHFKKIVSHNHQNISLFTTLLLLWGDIETCPGPMTLSELCKCR